ncbi:MAG TPA: type II toxin-antitoxin system VapC family toxin [Candidatus Ruania gallistercoris]|uniref:Ribonuclease VapC n=1 Tax=Candidatus Ruania gallistercoris TaxID=2838746 RepID=A0A9D2J4D1_9MICO|nr:type II toxin-antitoxin system VapC family toxin [Candidatus Ruania gallistercoris]
MIVLDANVVSEPMRPEPALQQVVRWLDLQSIETLYLTTITLAEIRFGIASLPVGRRRSTLERRFEEETVTLFSGRILPFDEPASMRFAQLQAESRSCGRALGTMDRLIAAICLAGGFCLATRNVKDFAFAGLQLIDPWEQS